MKAWTAAASATSVPEIWKTPSAPLAPKAPVPVPAPMVAVSVPVPATVESVATVGTATTLIVVGITTEELETLVTAVVVAEAPLEPTLNGPDSERMAPPASFLAGSGREIALKVQPVPADKALFWTTKLPAAVETVVAMTFVTFWSGEIIINSKFEGSEETWDQATDVVVPVIWVLSPEAEEGELIDKL